MIEIKIPAWHQHSVAHVMLFLKKHYAKHYDTAKQLITESPDGIEVEIRSLRKSRSRQQENYYRKWCRAFAKHTGLTDGEMHEELLCICYGSETTETMFGMKRRPLKRSGDTKKDTYGELIETLIRVAADMDFHVPPSERETDIV